MNSQQLVSVLKQDRYTAPLFRGVYPINRLPPIREGLYVVNTAPHTHPVCKKSLMLRIVTDSTCG